jgi:hypothetical protein
MARFFFVTREKEVVVGVKVRDVYQSGGKCEAG